MAVVRDSLIDLERHKRLLEENIGQLQNALQHWQIWDAEYEALKEEVDSTSELNTGELQRVKNEFEGELVTEKELKEIFGLDSQRSKDQILNVLDRRIDYVTRNIETLQKQLQAAENKHAAASIISQPDAEDEEGQPITEIIEELDDDDNIVSYQLNRPGESLPHIHEALRKVGVNELPDLDTAASSAVSHPLQTLQEPSSSAPQQESSKRKVTGQPAPTDIVPVKASKKEVSFADTPAPFDDEPLLMSRNAARVQNIMDTAKDQEKIMGQNPVIPGNEDPDDAALRQEMLRYSMGEVGAVVAELQLEEGNAEEDYEFEYSDQEFDDDDDEDEDKYGRYTGRVITDDYRERMLELEQKLGVKSRFSVKEEEREAAAAAAAAAAQTEDDSGSEDERIGRIVVKSKTTPSTTASIRTAPSQKSANKKTTDSTSNKKKGVRFADDLDIAPNDEPAPSRAPDAPTTAKSEPLVEPLSDIVERSPSTKQSKPKSSRQTSRFKSAKSEPNPSTHSPESLANLPASFHGQQRPAAPTGPDGATIADTLVERETVSSPMEDDEYDDYMIESEVASEHQRLRRKFIQAQGGFLKEDESPNQPIDENDGGQEKPSRFRAARLSRQ